MTIQTNDSLNPKQRDDFAIFILCHGRPDFCPTYKTLCETDNKYPVYFVLDNEDTTVDRYMEKYGEDRCLVFNKPWYADRTDCMDQLLTRTCAVFARTACYDLASYLGLKMFVVFDDDVTAFYYKTIHGSVKIRKLNRILTHFANFLDSTVYTAIAFSQGGEHFSSATDGRDELRVTVSHKCMNAWFCKTDKPLKFLGRMNDDVNTYSSYQKRGNAFLTVMKIALIQPPTQSVKGGMTDIYKNLGTYTKSFYTSMLHPTANRIHYMHSKRPRIHHKLIKNKIVPRVISPKYKKI